jgi:glutathione S-transferase
MCERFGWHCMRRVLHMAVWLAGSKPTLADLHAAPMFTCLLRTPEGLDLMRGVPSLMSWWETVGRRTSVAEVG